MLIAKVPCGQCVSRPGEDLTLTIEFDAGAPVGSQFVLTLSSSAGWVTSRTYISLAKVFAAAARELAKN